MGQNKNFIAARLPQELYDRLEATAGKKKGERTRIIIQAIAAYLDFPLQSTDTETGNNERFIALENRIAELEQQFQEFQEIVATNNQTDNTNQVTVIESDNSSDDSNNESKPNQLSLLEQTPGDDEEESKSLLGKILKTNEVPSLPGLEDESPDGIKIQLRNAKSQGKTPVKIGGYLLDIAGKEPGAKGSLLWKIIEDNN